MSKFRPLLIGAAVAALGGHLLACTPVEPAPVQPAEQAGGGQSAAPEQQAPQVKLTAKAVEHKPDEFVTGGPYSCVRVQIANNSKGVISAGVEYLTITGTDGTKRVTAWMVDSRELDSVQLAPGENAKGVVCAEGEFTPQTVAFDDFNHQARVQVAR